MIFRHLSSNIIAALLGLSALLPSLLRDAAGIAGAASLAYGAAAIYRPAGFIVGGVLLLAAALLTGRGSA